jgi:phosphoesterase RecJ-like protein
MGIKRVIESVKAGNNFLISAHVNLEGDALGSEIAFLRLLRAIGKKALIVNDEKAPCAYDFLPDLESVLKFSRKIRVGDFDSVVALDCSALKRTGIISTIDMKGKTVINVDHHISNEYFGDVNWVDPQASSASEMVYRLFKTMKIPLDRESALALYVGILTDTGSFRYANTTAQTHKIAAELLEYDLSVSSIYKRIYENVPFYDMRALIKALEKIRLGSKGRVAWVELKKREYSRRNMVIDLAEQILNSLRSIKGVEVVALFKENLKTGNEIRANLRSSGNVDVNKIAAIFGGGGHKNASGCTIIGKLEQVRKKVLKEIGKAL